jgi:hypothetical protein
MICIDIAIGDVYPRSFLMRLFPERPPGGTMAERTCFVKGKDEKNGALPKPFDRAPRLLLG